MMCFLKYWQVIYRLIKDLEYDKKNKPDVNVKTKFSSNEIECEIDEKPSAKIITDEIISDTLFSKILYILI
jgi:hypothetical protein